MNDTKQRILIGERHGWKLKFLEAVGLPPGIPYGYTDSCMGYFPDYLNDLNAIHQAWLILSPSEKERFESELYSIVVGEAEYNRNDDAGWITNATAAQRSEAFLKAIDKWIPVKTIS